MYGVTESFGRGRDGGHTPKLDHLLRPLPGPYCCYRRCNGIVGCDSQVVHNSGNGSYVCTSVSPRRPWRDLPRGSKGDKSLLRQLQGTPIHSNGSSDDLPS